MTEVGPDASVIDLGVPDAQDRVRHGPTLSAHLRRRLLIALLTMLCLLTVAASVRGRPSLRDPLWTGNVSLNGFTLGARSLYQWRLDGKAVTALDLVTGRSRWTRDITGVPQSIFELDHGVVVVATTQLPDEGGDGLDNIITLVREADGQPIAQTVGESFIPTGDDRRLLVFSRRSHGPDGCGESDASAICLDVTAWDVGTGAVAWQVNLPPNTGFVPSIVDSRIESLAEIHPDGTVLLRDVSTGAVAGRLGLRPGELVSRQQVGLVRGALLTAERGPEGITVTAYQRPSLTRSWSAVVPDNTAINDQGDGFVYLWECGPDACLTVHGVGSWVINESTGSVTTGMRLELATRLGDGVFLASALHADPVAAGTGFVVAPDGRTLATLAAASLVDWTDNDHRGMVALEGTGRTDFRVVDKRGTVRILGSVPGTRLTCHGQADILACSNPAGALRVWRFPL